MREADLQGAVVDMCRLFSIAWYHTQNSRRCVPGWPDLALCGSRGFILRELKTATGRLTAEQQHWGIALRNVGVSWDVWRPADLHSGRVQRELEAIRLTRETGQRELARPNWEYFRVDVLIMEHPKIEELSDKGFRELIGLWAYCGRNRNDGIVTERRWKSVPAKVRAELLARGLVDPVDIGGSAVMHDFVGDDGHQRSRQEIEEAAEARKEKARHAAETRWSKPRAVPS